MNRHINILFVEDREEDIILLLREFKNTDFNVTWQRVFDEKGMKKALKENNFHLIISDYSLPGFGGLGALNVVKELLMDIPFIMVSGAVGEKAAVEAMKNGAHDFIIKGNFIRLLPAIERELKELQQRNKRRESEKALRITQYSIDHFKDGIIWLDNKANVLYVNDAVCQMLGYTKDELLTSRLHLFENDLSQEKWEKRQDFFKKMGKINIETIYRDRNNTLIPVEVLANYFEYEGDEYIFSFIRDLTQKKREDEEKKHLEEELRQALKMDAIGRLAGGIAHDFNNILTSIIGNLSLIMVMVDKEDKIYELLELINTAAERSKVLIKQLLSFSRKEIIEPKKVNLNFLISDLEKMLAPIIGEDVNLKTKLKSSLGFINADAGKIEQIILNLVVNARDAVPNGGEIIIATDELFLTEGCCADKSAMKSGYYIMLSVSDNGIGIPQENIIHLFEPFFTTKPVGKGTGLGLATVFGIVKQHNGHISVDSAVGKGSSFKIYFPKNESEHGEKLLVKNLERKVFGNEAIIIAEDDEIVKKLTENMMKKAGFNVLLASSATDCIQFVKNYQEKIDLLITDVIMPQINGIELYEKLLLHYPKLKVLYMSGYAEDVIAKRCVLTKGISFLQKPFSLHGLTNKVREVLDN